MNDGTALNKMPVEVEDDRVRYTLVVEGERIAMNELVGMPFGLRATGVLSCIVCGRRVKKHYGQGFCFPCLQSAPEASECIVRPELCQAHLGGGRDPEWERAHHATEHVVYLSYTGDVKVGVTRSTQVPTRWVDQGAVAALIIARVPYRQLAGALEVAIKNVMADRTNWRAMLKKVDPSDELLLLARDRAFEQVSGDLREHLVTDATAQHLHYPVVDHPAKVTSVNLTKDPLLTGRLVGLKGQYLMWEDGRVLNVRSHSGVHVVRENVARV
ncbi:MAG: DUF2797 domain-containing protein [Flavobacteriales bacterium]|jgi:hypothetical protein|nr:DUF2797 domain-containing protein [Flavobacteriales bacterium]MBP7449199.1 DUF2797 domain-containing protein [Flavobacteriales bacterium]HOZ40529.1 DUF2797 domain-containing protein [Flavobacteriales bacterium]